MTVALQVPARLFGIDGRTTTDDWYTPAWVFEGMGVTFDLDVAAPDGGVPWIPTKHCYTIADDGLLQPWFGLVWCNPPYSAPAPWCRKWATHSDGLLLIRADLSTSGPATAFAAATSIHAPGKRLQFVNGQGGKTGVVSFSTVILGRGKMADRALVNLERARGGSTRLLGT